MVKENKLTGAMNGHQATVTIRKGTITLSETLYIAPQKNRIILSI